MRMYEIYKMWADVNSFIDKAETKRTIPCMILFYNSTWSWKTSESWDIEVAEPQFPLA